MNTAAPIGLPALEARLHQDLAWLDLPAKTWIPATVIAGQTVLDVAIIGAGMAGLAVATALKHLGVHSINFDRTPTGFEGPWANTARMETLRSPKQLTGPALGLPALTFRAWFEAQFGAEQWTTLDKIPRLQWMDYLRWYRRVMQVEVRNDTHLTAITPRTDALVQLSFNDDKGAYTVLARRVVLATGRDGLGGPALPPFAQTLARTHWAHSADVLDYRGLAGKRIVVIGAGASAMDSAATALEAGASNVDILVRREDIPRINKGKGAGNAGLTYGHLDLPDAWKWRLRHYLNKQQVPPPRASMLRVSRHDNVRFHLGCPILTAKSTVDGVALHTPKGVFHADFVIFSTGFRLNWQARPEFAAIASHIRLWRDHYQTTNVEADQELADSPDLGPVFELREKTPGACPSLARIHCFCYPATLTHGAVSGDIPAISEGAKRLAQGLASLFYGEDIEQHFSALQRYAEPEVLGDEWAVAAAPTEKS